MCFEYYISTSIFSQYYLFIYYTNNLILTERLFNLIYYYKSYSIGKYNIAYFPLKTIMATSDNIEQKTNIKQHWSWLKHDALSIY